MSRIFDYRYTIRANNTARVFKQTIFRQSKHTASSSNDETGDFFP